MKRYVGTAEIEGRLGGVLDDGRAVFLGQRQHPEDATDTAGAVMVMDVIDDGADGGTEAVGGGQQRERFRWGAARTIRVLDAMPAARRADMLAE